MSKFAGQAHGSEKSMFLLEAFQKNTCVTLQTGPIKPADVSTLYIIHIHVCILSLCLSGIATYPYFETLPASSGAMVGALSFNLIVLLVRLVLSQKSKIPEKEEKKHLADQHFTELGG